MKKTLLTLLSLLLVLLSLSGCIEGLIPGETTPGLTTPPETSAGPLDAATLAEIPPFTGYPFVTVYDNIPTFEESELSIDSYEFYSELDALGRCGYAEASIGQDLMPTEDREEIGSVTPSGWEGNNHRYDSSLVSGGYIYNRSHLIGFQLTGENANRKNLITGTRFFNVEGMLPFENMVADYVKETNNHVMYRVTPIYVGAELVARGVLMEAYSVEDDGDGICFCVYVYNNQPGITIDYATGENYLSNDPPPGTTPPVTTPPVTNEDGEIVGTYILNTSSKRFHDPDCSSVKTIKEHNKQEYTGSREDLIDEGYTACGSCKP